MILLEKKKRPYLLLLFALAFMIQGTAQAQVHTSKSLTRIQTAKFEPQWSNEHMLYVPMGFNESDAMARLKDIDPDEIVSVTLVYTLYRASERFDQMKLNNDRTHELFKQMPQLSENPNIKWYWVAQSGCNDPTGCRDFFHGFEIRTRSTEEIKREETDVALLEFYTAKYADGETSSEKLDSLSRLEGSTILKHCDTTFEENPKRKSRLGKLTPIHKKSEIKFVRKAKRRGYIKAGHEVELVTNKRGRLIEVNGIPEYKKPGFYSLFSKYYRLRPSKYHGKRVASIYTLTFDTVRHKMDKFVLPVDDDFEEIDSFYSTVEYVEVVRCNYIDTSRKMGGMYHYNAEDVVTKVFDRNKHWKNNIVITDVTGSMYPYLGQFLAWHQLNLKHSKNNNFVFFNDGNNMADYLKVAGKVGGLYHAQTPTYPTLKSKLYLAQAAGGGGDGPENNIEAALFAIKKAPRTSGIIMIADNWATPRDLELLEKVNKPIHVVLCGVRGGINTEYLNMIRKNGGTLHTIEDDLTELATMSEGEEIEVAGMRYVIKGGKFVSMSTSGAADFFSHL